MDPSLALLACPSHGALQKTSRAALECLRCDRTFRRTPEGIWEEPLNPRWNSTAVDLAMRWSGVARIYERAWRPRLVAVVSDLDYAFEDALVDRYLPRPEDRRVLELCSGTGRAARRLVDRGAVALAVDTSPAMLREARRLCEDERLVLVRADARRRIAAVRGFDLAICFAALHLFADPTPVIESAATALRPGGTFVAWAVTRRGFFARHGVGRVARRLGLTPFEPGALAAAAIGAGLVVREEIALGVLDVIAATADTPSGGRARE